MSDEPKKRSGGWIWGPAALIVLLAVYVGGYFVLCDEYSFMLATASRSYRSSTVAFAYVPLAWLNAKLWRHDVVLEMPGPSAGGRLIHFEP
jgi:hypothetical protein